MHESAIRELQVLMFYMSFLPKARSLANKWWVRLVPAAAVTPAPQVGATIIGPKASVAGLSNLL